MVDFFDFFFFADHFNLTTADEDWDPISDLNANGKVDLGDFFIFAGNFGKRLIPVSSEEDSSGTEVDTLDGPVTNMLISSLTFEDTQLANCIRELSANNNWEYTLDVTMLNCSNRFISQ